MNIREKIAKAMLDGRHANKVLSCNEIRDIVIKKYPEVFYRSIFPGVFCDNKKDRKITNAIFHYIDKNQYKVLSNPLLLEALKGDY